MALLSKIRIQNVLSIKDLTLKFNGAGVYHISGANNIGKTTILRAIDALFNNVPNVSRKDYCRDDTNTFIVEGWFDDGNRVKLSRGEVDYYEWDIDGNYGRLDNTSGKVPEVLVKYFNLYIDEKDKENLNIRYKDDKTIFTKTSTQANYRYLEKALGTEMYSKAYKKTITLRKDLLSENKVLNTYLVKETDELKVLEQQETDIRGKMDAVKRISTNVDRLVKGYKLLKSLNSATEDIRVLMSELKNLSGGLNTINLDALNEDVHAYSNLEKADVSFNSYKKLHTLEDDLKIVSQIDLNTPDRLIQAFELLHRVNTASTTQKLLESKLEGNKAIVEKLQLGSIEDELTVVESLNKLMVSASEGSNVVKRVKIAEADLEEATNNLEDYLGEFEVCPFCGNEMKGEHVHG